MNPNPYEETAIDEAELARFEAETSAYLDTLTTDAGAGRSLLLTPASEITMRPVVWLWEDRIPLSALTLIPGREGIGKSLLLCWLIARVTRGELPGVFYGSPRAVIYAASEDSWAQTIAPRLHAAGADLELVFRIEVEQDGLRDQLTLPLDNSAVARVVVQYQVALLAADPLLSLVDGDIDTHHDRDMRKFLEPLSRLAHDTGCAVVGLAHFNKSASADALNLITGSRAFSAVARAVISIARDTDAEDGSCVLSQAKNNLGRLDLPSLRYIVEQHAIETPEGPAHVGRLEFTGISARSVSDILADGANPGTERGESTDAARWLTAYMAEHADNGEVEAGAVQKAAAMIQISKSALYRARTRLGITTGKSSFGSGWVWTLPAEGSAKNPKAPGPRNAEPSNPSGPEVEPSPADPTLPFQA